MSIDNTDIEMRVKNLIDLAIMKQSAADALTEAVEEESERTGIKKSLIRKYTTAVVKGEVEDLVNEAEQLMTLLKEGLKAG